MSNRRLPADKTEFPGRKNRYSPTPERGRTAYRFGVMISAAPPLRASPTSVALVGHSRLVGEAIALMLNRFDDLKVVYGHASDAITPMKKARPQVVLLDIGLQRGDSLRLAARVRHEFPDVRVIVMDRTPIHDDVVEFVNAGVAGFIIEDVSVDELVNTIRLVDSGANVLPPVMVKALFSRLSHEMVVQSPAPTSESVRMTPREREVISLIAAGLSNKEIAARLTLATNTVKSRVSTVMDKLALHTRL